jgi:hypothetical protein
MFDALTLATILEPHGSKNGSVLRVAIGIEQDLDALIEAFDPSQFKRSWLYSIRSDLRISIL